LVDFVLKDPGFHSAALNQFGYDFGNAQIGLELGPTDRWVFFVRAGISYVHPSYGVPTIMTQAAQQAINWPSTPALSGFAIASVKAGLALYVF
jgi:hypothetical protein